MTALPKRSCKDTKIIFIFNVHMQSNIHYVYNKQADADVSITDVNKEL